MSTTPEYDRTSRCSEVYFAEVDFPGPIHPRLVIEYSDGIRILVESERDLALAAEFVRLKRQLERKGSSL